MNHDTPDTVFLLSPATTHGPRARVLRRADATSALAHRMRAEGVPLGEVFSFLSGLYFRGKLEYARRFARTREAIHVISMTDGLMSPDVRITVEDLDRFSRADEDPGAVRQQLMRAASAVHSSLAPDARIVLLGSVSTGKYTDVLLPLFGKRLLFPRAVLHIGQLARGALFLRHAQEGRELEYAPVAGIERVRGRAALTTQAPSHPQEDAARETP